MKRPKFTLLFISTFFILIEQSTVRSDELLEPNQLLINVEKSLKLNRKINFILNNYDIKLIVSLNDPVNNSAEEDWKSIVGGIKKAHPKISKKQIKELKTAYENNKLEKTIIDKKDENNNISISGKLSLTEENKPKNRKKEKTIKRIVDASEEQNKENKKEESNENKTLIEEGRLTVTQQYTIKEGDTLSDIAQREYNDASLYTVIYEANKDKLQSEHAIPAGITLNIPATSTLKINNNKKIRAAKKHKKELDHKIYNKNNHNRISNKKMKEILKTILK